jgi:hypothetical protein
LLHPLPGRLALVRLAAAHPAGSSGLRAIVSVRHDQAHPIDFAIWLRPATAAPLDEAALSEAEGFSGWHSVAKPWQRHPIALLLPAPAETALDIYLATRVPGFPDVHFCHANWDEIWTILKPGPKAGRPAHRPGRA